MQAGLANNPKEFDKRKIITWIINHYSTFSCNVYTYK